MLVISGGDVHRGQSLVVWAYGKEGKLSKSRYLTNGIFQFQIRN